jgi:hypothetical protein
MYFVSSKLRTRIEGSTRKNVERSGLFQDVMRRCCSCCPTRPVALSPFYGTSNVNSVTSLTPSKRDSVFGVHSSGRAFTEWHGVLSTAESEHSAVQENPNRAFGFGRSPPAQSRNPNRIEKYRNARRGILVMSSPSFVCAWWGFAAIKW